MLQPSGPGPGCTVRIGEVESKQSRRGRPRSRSKLGRISGPGQSVCKFPEILAKAGLEVVDVSLHRPNLESVFLPLTGRELRD